MPSVVNLVSIFPTPMDMLMFTVDVTKVTYNCVIKQYYLHVDGGEYIVWVVINYTYKTFLVVVNGKLNAGRYGNQILWSFPFSTNAHALRFNIKMLDPTRLGSPNISSGAMVLMFLCDLLNLQTSTLWSTCGTSFDVVCVNAIHSRKISMN